MSLKKGDIRRAFTYFESGSVVLVTTSDGQKDNVMTISWQMVMDFIPHIAISTGGWNESYRTIIEQKECCICVPTFDMIENVIDIGVVHGSENDKFKKFALNKQAAENVKAPLLADCLASLECKLESVVEDYGLLIFKGVQLWENDNKQETRTFHANGDGTFFADGEFINLRERMRKWVPNGSERL